MFKLSCHNVNKIDWKNANTCLFDLKDVTVWKLHNDRFNSSLDQLHSLLQQDEKNKAGFFKFEKDSNAYSIRRGMLKLLISKYLSLDPVSLLFYNGKNNKPALENNYNSAELFFNVSYSKDITLIAIADHDIGLDIEKVDSTFDYKEILQVLFSEKEKELILHADNAANMFYTLFTRKESIVKASGKGISNSMIDILVTDGDHFINDKDGSFINSDLRVNSFFLDTEYIASIACKNSSTCINFYEADESLIG